MCMWVYIHEYYCLFYKKGSYNFYSLSPHTDLLIVIYRSIGIALIIIFNEIFATTNTWPYMWISFYGIESKNWNCWAKQHTYILKFNRCWQMAFPKPITPHIFHSHETNPFPKSPPVIFIITLQFLSSDWCKMTLSFTLICIFPTSNKLENPSIYFFEHLDS